MEISKPKELDIISGTTIIPPKAANICWNPKRIFVAKLGLSSTPYLRLFWFLSIYEFITLSPIAFICVYDSVSCSLVIENKKTPRLWYRGVLISKYKNNNIVKFYTYMLI